MKSLLRILIAPLIWLAAFSAIYGLQGLGCAADWDEVRVLGLGLNRVLLGLAWVIAVILQAGILIALERRPDGSIFIQNTSRLTAGTALVATLWSLFPVAVISSCI